jgi:hypothetical protein
VLISSMLLGLALALPLPALAQDYSYDHLVAEALTAYGAGQWDEARRLFEQAHGIEPTARTLRTIGMCAFNQGDFVAALQNLEAALVDPRKPLTEELRAHVTGLIERANAEVGRYRLRLDPPDTKLLVDGKSPVLISQGQLVLTPGRHEIVAATPGHETVSRKLDVLPNDRAELEFTLGAASTDHPTIVPLPAPTGAQPAATAPAEASSGQRVPPPAKVAASNAGTWGAVALSLGAASLIASGVSTAIAIGQKSDLENDCPNQACPPPAYDHVDRYDTLRVISIATLAGGVLGVGLGLFLLLGSDDTPEGSAVQATIAPGWVQVSGRL